MEAIATGVAWFITSALFSTWANTAFLGRFESTLGHTIVRFAGSALLSALALGPTQALSVLRRGFWDYKLPAACLFLANFSNSVALANTGITLTYVVKSSIPVVTVLLCVLQGGKFPAVVYLTLLPTVLGVSLASASDVNFDSFGLAAALASTLATTLLNIKAKQTAERTGIRGLASFFLMSTAAACLCLPVFIFTPSAPVFGRVWADLTADTGVDTGSLVMLVAAALAYQFEYSLNFVFSAYVDPVTFSVADIGRRLGIIVTGAIVFNKPLSPLNIAGCLLALAGVLAYNLVNVGLKSKVKTAAAVAAANPDAPKKRV